MILLLSSRVVDAALIWVELYVDMNELVDNNGNTLADGSLIQIIQSSNSSADGFQTWGSHYIINSTAGDDVILASTTVGAGGVAANDGRFFWTAELDIDVNSTYFYIRFFDFPAANLMDLYFNPSNLYWGTSAVFLAGNYDSNLYVDIDFAASTNLATSLNNSFVVIPEPSSISFFALVGGLAMAMRSRLRKRARSDSAGD